MPHDGRPPLGYRNFCRSATIRAELWFEPAYVTLRHLHGLVYLEFVVDTFTFDGVVATLEKDLFLAEAARDIAQEAAVVRCCSFL